jgi:leader peptidase (prepilin peptidase)/N-methyltransferase
MIIAVLVVLGLCFGSFVNALVWRIHKQSTTKNNKARGKYSISKGRSMCVHCGHQLSSIDLLPVVGWLMLRGKCRYCQRPISWQYPAVELAVAVLFVNSYIFWSQELRGFEIASFGLWLVSLIGMVALIVYDIRWMLLPNRIIFPLYGVAAAFVLSRALSNQDMQPIIEGIIGVLIGGGLFYVLFQISRGTWIGGGDVKLGFLVGALVGGPENSLLLLFLASLLGTLIALPLMAAKIATRKTRIPFGPFLIAAVIIVQLFGTDLTDWYLSTFVTLGASL